MIANGGLEKYRVCFSIPAWGLTGFWCIVVEFGRIDLTEELMTDPTTAAQRRIKLDQKQEAEIVHLAQ